MSGLGGVERHSIEQKAGDTVETGGGRGLGGWACTDFLVPQNPQASEHVESIRRFLARVKGIGERSDGEITGEGWHELPLPTEARWKIRGNHSQLNRSRAISCTVLRFLLRYMPAMDV